MNFIDSTGHIFNLPSFNYNPIGYEYTENRHIFWLEDKTTSFLSVGNYYIRPIYFISDYQLSHVDITINSSVFKLVGSKFVQESLSKYGYVKLNDNLLESVEDLIYDNEKGYDEYNDIIEVPISVNLNDETLDLYDEYKYVYMYPFYVVGMSQEEGTITSNILIHAIRRDYYIDDSSMDIDDYLDSSEFDDMFDEAHDYCPITVGGAWSETNEILIINGQNMGVELPAEIIKAVYEGSYKDKVFNEALYNQKLKEYLINYMGIRGEIGNYNSAINSLKWFGWGKHLNIVSLFETDNQYCVQFVRDYFDINTDIIESFKHFRNSTLLSLIVKYNKELLNNDGNIVYDPYNLDAEFMGENQPIMEDLFKRFDKRKIGGRGEETYYWHAYYNFIFDELSLKLSALKFFYEKYFLPVHLSINTASIELKVYTNDNKQLARSNSSYTEKIIELGMDIEDLVSFPKTNIIWLNEQTHIIDENYNEWTNPNYNNDDYYYIHDTCMNIPIKFNTDRVCDVVMILEKNALTRPTYPLYINEPINIKYDDFCIYDDFEYKLKKDDLTSYPCTYSEDKNGNYTIWFNNFSTLLEHYDSTHYIDYDLTNEKDDVFVFNLHEVLNKYFKTNININNYVIYTSPNNTGLLVNNYTSRIDDATNVKITEDNKIFYLYRKIQTGKNVIDIEKRPEIIITIPDFTNINVNPLTDNNGKNSAHARFQIYQDIYLKYKYPSSYIEYFFINNEDKLDSIYVGYFPTSNVVFEKHFRFDPTIDEYADLVIYPKLFTNVNTDEMTNRHFTDDLTQLSYWIGSRFTLRVLVNNKWHSYKFMVKIPSIQFDLGKLVYKYWDDPLKLQSRFNQLSELSYDEYGDINIEFNSFMHETDLVTVNHINFFEDFVKYLKTTSARFINGDIIRNNKTYAFIDVDYTDEQGINHNQRIYFPDENVGSDIVVPKKYFETDMIYFLYYRNEIFLLSDSQTVNDVYKVKLINVNDSNSSVNIVGGNDFVLSIDNNTLLDTGYESQYIDTNNYKIFKYDSTKHKYYLDILGEHYEYKIKLSMKETIDNFTSKYIEQHFITDTDKYKNQLHVFDLLRLNYHTDSNRLFIHNNIDFKYHGIRFKHDNYIDESKLEISGNIGDLIDNIEERNPSNNLFNTEIAESSYAGFINTYDDLTIYSAYNGDFIMKSEEPEPIGYVYYECTDIDGNLTGEIYDSPQQIVTTDILLKEEKIMHISDISKYIKPGNYPVYINIENEKYELKFNNKEYLDEWGTRKNPEYMNMYVERNNINSDITSMYFTLELIEVTGRQGNDIITYNQINPIRSEFFKEIYDYENDTFKDNGIVSNDPDFHNVSEDGNYRFIFRLYYKKKVILNNIEHIYRDTYTVNDIGEAWGIVNGQYIRLHPYYGDIEDNLDDTLVTKEILKQQPGYYWFNVDDSFLYIDEYMEILDVDNENDMNSIEKTDIDNKIFGEDIDISTLTKWRKYLRIDITQKILKDIKDWLPIATSSNLHYDIINDKINEGFITVVKITNQREQISYYTTSFDINIIDVPKNITVFFAIDKNSVQCDENGDFVINVAPEIRRSYYSYDPLEYTPLEYVDDDTSITITLNDGTKLTYGDLNYQSRQLYMNMFTTRVDKFNDNIQFKSIECIPTLNIDNGNITYDMYLMHDNKQWYVVYISKDTCDHIVTLYNYKPSTEEIYFIDNKQGQKYKLKYVSSGQRFLLNRYKYESANGKNIFNTRDIIAARVINNNRLPIDITMSNKWEVTPLSFGIPSDTLISKSNAQMCIIDMPYDNNEHYSGYYNITYRYNIDRIANHQNKLTGRFRVIK